MDYVNAHTKELIVVLPLCSICLSMSHVNCAIWLQVDLLFAGELPHHLSVVRRKHEGFKICYDYVSLVLTVTGVHVSVDLFLV